MQNELFNKLESLGYKVTNRGLVKKYSQKAKGFEVAGQINRGGVYFYAQNVSPFKTGQNTFSEILENNKPFIYKPFVSKNTIQHNFTFDDYLQTTKAKNQFSIFLNQFHKKTLNKKLDTNLYDIRGVKNGSFEDATLFPYINFHNEFITAKVVKYNSNTGKRIKEGFSNTWFHAERSIKKELGIKDKIEKKIDCFFGEHLLAYNNNPVVIVEAEKTAVLLSLIYKETIFIATGGLAKLKNLDFSILANRDVFVFPDNGAKEWFEIAKERSWYVSEVIEKHGLSGEDAADYYTTFLDDKERSDIWYSLHNEFWNIDNKELTTENIEGLSLAFKNKKELSFNYCIPVSKETKLNYYWDNAQGETAFKGKHFQIFNNQMFGGDFQVLNANVDFNRVHKTEFGWQQLDAHRFLILLEKTFRIVKHLNPETYKKHFTEVLYNLRINSNHTFNVNYIERVILPIWDKGDNNIIKYIKYRNWRFSSTETIDKKDFVRSLNNDKKLSSTNQYLTKLLPLLKEDKFILPEYIGLHQRRENIFIDNIIREYNTKVLGCKTIKSFNSKVEIANYLNWWRENLGENKKHVQKFATTYNSNSIRWQENVHTFKKPSQSIINENTLVGRRIIEEYFNFKPDKNCLIDIIEKVNYYISNPQEFTFDRTEKRLVIIPKEMEVKEEIRLSTKEAFSYEIDTKESPLNVSEEIAMMRGDDFLSSWILFHNPELSDKERQSIIYCPMLFFEKTKNLIQNVF